MFTSELLCSTEFLFTSQPIHKGHVFMQCNKFNSIKNHYLINLSALEIQTNKRNLIFFSKFRLCFTLPGVVTARK